MLPSAYLTDDHKRLNALLAAATPNGTVDREAYEVFRLYQYRHAVIEEEFVIPLIKEKAEGGFFAIRQIQYEHSAIAALLVLEPTGEVLAVLRALLDKHKLLEETNRTMYDVLDQCSQTEQPELLAKMQEYPDPELPVPEGDAMEHAREMIARAGYDWEKLSCELKDTKTPSHEGK
ncbi:hemerythrin domain-containing protein [bacterium]|nr:hemerythrin domain-containing protein [bacterium]